MRRTPRAADAPRRRVVDAPGRGARGL